MTRWLLVLAWITGIVLRVVFVEDMEYKEDEELNFTHSQLIGGAQGWPWVGMPSGVFIPNPGMSYWVFAVLAKIARATTPTDLARALQIFSILGITLLIPFAYRFVKKEAREPWLWAFALAMVNPFAVFYQRKLWPEPFLPFFSMLMLMGWWTRSSFLGAFTWGVIGAILGQIHMSGFFLAGGFFLWTLFYRNQPTHWKAWFAGSCLGALPLIPWAIHVLQNPVHEHVASGFQEAIQLKFWVFWLTNPLGLTLGNPLGLLRGNSQWEQISDFVRYPILAGHPTYLNAVAHLVILALALWIFFQAIRKRSFLPRTETQTGLAVSAALWGFGILMTLSTVNIRRYYTLASFPFDLIWFVGVVFATVGAQKIGNARRVLMTFWIAQLLISACFVGYIHVNEGSIHGDYGLAYHRVMKLREQSRQSSPSP